VKCDSTKRNAQPERLPVLGDAEPPDDIGAIITTYHSARLYIGRIPSDRFQMLVLDEAHKLRNLYGTPQTPQVAFSQNT